jgi:hypothetical protein
MGSSTSICEDDDDELEPDELDESLLELLALLETELIESLRCRRLYLRLPPAYSSITTAATRSQSGTSLRNG